MHIGCIVRRDTSAKENARMKRELQWGKIPLDLKKEYVRLLLTDGFTRTAIGLFFGTSKNAIVGFQHTHLPKLTGKGTGSKGSVTRVILEQLLKGPAENAPRTRPAPDPDQAVPQAAEVSRKAPIEPSAKSEVSRKLTTDWRIQCKHTEGCAYMCLPDSNSCGRPGHDK
jgi:hypothetical protein